MPSHALSSELIDLLKAIKSGTYDGPGADVLNGGVLLPTAAQVLPALPDVTAYSPGQIVVVPEDALYVAVGTPGVNYSTDFTLLPVGDVPNNFLPSDGSGYAFGTNVGSGVLDPISDGLGITSQGQFRLTWQLPAIPGKLAVVIHGSSDGSENSHLNVGFRSMEDGNGGYWDICFDYGGLLERWTDGNGGTLLDGFGTGSNEQGELLYRALSNNGTPGPFTATLLVDTPNNALVASYNGSYGPLGPLLLDKTKAPGGITDSGTLTIQLQGPQGSQHLTSVSVQAAGSLHWDKTALVAA